ncbi:MAG: APC family permease [Sandaracinaceae bacterium]|nr:APC family permease [Sandaracinaceae bacterium]
MTDTPKEPVAADDGSAGDPADPNDCEDARGGSTPPPADTDEFAGWGTAAKLEDLEGPGSEGVELKRLDQPEKHLLGTWASTAICGNDITSSCLYVSALVAAEAGALAPIVLAVVAGVLFLFRYVYAEVGSALPLNGGTYTVLLNTTNKKLAASAAVLTLLSYVATAVISAGEAMEYAHNLYHGLDVFSATLILLGFFAFLNVIGISESAVVALFIFITHMLTLTLLSGISIIAVVSEPQMFLDNWATVGDVSAGGLVRALFLGFASAMLGISGFESSANFIEEQKPGVFPKTLRNMWGAVSVFNPIISLLSLGILPLLVIQTGNHGEPLNDLLARMANSAMHQLTGSGAESTDGTWLGILVSVDAVLVLSGAVLTSFVGVTGLVRRMTLDRCLPQVLLQENKLRKTNHWIILGFFLVSCSILAATSDWAAFTTGEGPIRLQVDTLAGVYTISFLAVMSLFAIGNMLLKVKRGRLPRETRAGWVTVVIALLAVLVGLVGNVVKDPEGVRVFATYFLLFGAVVGVMFLRIQLLKVTLFVSNAVIQRVEALSSWLAKGVREKIDQINGRVVIYFTRGDDMALLNRAALYVIENEQTNRLKVVHVYQDENLIPKELEKTLRDIDHLYPDLRIDFLAVKGQFTPELIERLSERLNVPKNYMFIGTPGDHFPHRIEALGGVRLIL